jgi:hypothetical protein
MKRIAFLFFLAASTAFACGSERWSVKTLTDKDAARISEQPLTATIEDLTNIPAPARSAMPNDGRLGPELHTYLVTGYLVGFKKEADEDFHIVIADLDNPKATMVVEMAAPDCVGDDYQKQFATEREEWEKRFGKATAKFKDVHAHKIKVQFVGVGFFDFIHGQTGVAKNGFELHPVLAWEEVFFRPVNAHEILAVSKGEANATSSQR